jgi:hypothetical protein
MCGVNESQSAKGWGNKEWLFIERWTFEGLRNYAGRYSGLIKSQSHIFSRNLKILIHTRFSASTQVSRRKDTTTYEGVLIS